MSGIIVKPRAGILRGHDWVYSNEILKTFGNPSPGDVISVRDGRNRLLGSAIYNPRSIIVARRFSRQRQILDADFFRRRIALAESERNHWGVRSDLRRIVHSDADGLPGVILDRYGSVIVLQTLTAAMDARLDMLTEAVREVLAPDALIERNEAPVRKAEGLAPRTGVLFGTPAQELAFDIAGVTHRLNPKTFFEGHKTGLYLDQLENYEKIAFHAPGRRVLDCFSYRGGFGLACLNAGAVFARCVESSENAADIITETARSNGLTVEVECANVFDILKRETRAGATYDLIVLDPPSFTKTREERRDALRGFKELHIRAFQLLTPGGLLASFSCSHHVSEGLLLDTAREALLDVKRSARVVQRLFQGRDHPILALVPETAYLSGLLFEMMPGR